MTALAETAAPGVSEYELVAAIEAAYTRAGGEHGIHFLSTTSMDAPQSYVPAQTQTGRRLQSGEENMAVVVQPNVYDPASGAGLQVGNLLVITRNGAESFS